MKEAKLETNAIPNRVNPGTRQAEAAVREGEEVRSLSPGSASGRPERGAFLEDVRAEMNGVTWPIFLRFGPPR